jgi:hypothetical protein
MPAASHAVEGVGLISVKPLAQSDHPQHSRRAGGRLRALNADVLFAAGVQ